MKLTYNEIANLAVEINGNGRELKGILKQKVSMKVKVQIHRLNQVVQDELKIFEELRKELFTKHGEEKDGSITIPPDKIKDFQPEFEELLSFDYFYDCRVKLFCFHRLDIVNLQRCSP